MKTLDNGDKSLFFKFRFKTGMTLTIFSALLYFFLYLIFRTEISYDSIFFLIIPAIISSSFLGMNYGIAVTMALPAITGFIDYFYFENTLSFIPKYAAGAVINLVASVTVGKLRDMHLKLLTETGRRKEIESDKEKQQKSVKQLETRLRSIFENASIGFYRISPQGSILMVNPALLKMMKYPFFEIVYQQDMSGEHYPHHNIADFRERMERDGKIIGLESEWRRYDGTIINIHETAWVVKDDLGETLYYDGIISDITEIKETEKALRENMELLTQEISERKKTEKILKESEERYRDLVEKAGVAIVTDDFSGKITYFNNLFVELFGFKEDEIRKMNIFDFVHPDDVEKVRENHTNRIKDANIPSRYEFKCVKKDSSIIYIEVEADNLSANGEIIGTRSYMWDITDRKLAEFTAHENSERFRGIIDNSTVGFYRTTPDGRILMANQALLRMLNYPSLDILTRRNLESEPQQTLGRINFRKHIESDGVVFGYEDEWLRYDNTTISIRESAWLIKDIKGAPLYYEGFVEDMSEFKRHSEEIGKLNSALEKISAENTLYTGLLMVCSSCKKIKDKDGVWVNIIDYIGSDKDAGLSRKICPECAQKLSSSLGQEL